MFHWEKTERKPCVAVKKKPAGNHALQSMLQKCTYREKNLIYTFARKHGYLLLVWISYNKTYVKVPNVRTTFIFPI